MPSCTPARAGLLTGYAPWRHGMLGYGDMLGDHHHWRKTYPYEGSAHVPCVVKWPAGMTAEIRRGSTLDHLVELRDVLPTVLDAAGAAIPPEIDGRSLLSVVRRRSAPWRSQLDLEHATCYRPENDWAALTDGREKYIFNLYTGGEQLFDLWRPIRARHATLRATRPAASRSPHGGTGLRATWRSAASRG